MLRYFIYREEELIRNVSAIYDLSRMRIRDTYGQPGGPVALTKYIDEVCLTLRERSFGNKIIYTTLFGPDDSLKQPQRPQPGWELVCVTNRRDLSFGNWTPVIVDTLHRDPRRTARVFKILPWVLFPNVEKSLFLDASIRIVGSVDDFLERYCADADLSCFVHPARNCTYAEAIECIKRGKDDSGTINAQMEAYRQEGFPAESGLVASAVMMRSHLSDEVRALMTRWADEVERHSVRDQLSFNFSAWILGASYNRVCLNIFDNEFFDVLPHTRLRRYDTAGQDVTGLRERIDFWIMKAKSYIRRFQRHFIRRR